MKYYQQLLGYTKSAVTRNYGEKSINNILDLISAGSELEFMENLYCVTLNALSEQKNEVFSLIGDDCSYFGALLRGFG